MTDAPLHQNVYRPEQKEFDAIPSGPWVYWLSKRILDLFTSNDRLQSSAIGKHGLSTCDTPRYVRLWWELGKQNIAFGVTEAESTTKNGHWFPFMKGGGYQKWYGNQEYIVNWQNNGKEVKADVKQKFPYLGNNLEFVLSSDKFYFREGVTWSKVTSSGLSLRYLPKGFICADAGMAFYADNGQQLKYLALSNSRLISYIMSSISPTINFTIGDILSIPVPDNDKLIKSGIDYVVAGLVRARAVLDIFIDETTFNFIAPLDRGNGLQNAGVVYSRVNQLESLIEDEVFALYGISTEDRTAIEAELASGLLGNDEEEPAENKDEDTEPSNIISIVTTQELSVRWISYAVGAVLGRFRPGTVDFLGSAIYRRTDFAIDSVPAPDVAEFDELVGPTKQFAYVDEDGGRHVFSAQAEKALQSLALPDGIAVFEEGHPRDLPALVEKALNLLLGEQAASEVIREATGGDTSTSLSASLRKFLEKDFFTGWHFKWYRKRPVYWPIQSSKRAYGFVLFHEKITHDTFYTIQREPYLDTKRNAVALKMADLQSSLVRSTGTAAKKLERELDDLRKLSDELAEFAKELEAITMGGYEPEPDWIDDGVILRMAPLWKVIPIWKSEPKKYWERLAAGDYDWSRIAMKYWPKRVRDKCKTNKSYAIAHGHEEWYQG